MININLKSSIEDTIIKLSRIFNEYFFEQEKREKLVQKKLIDGLNNYLIHHLRSINGEEKTDQLIKNNKKTNFKNQFNSLNHKNIIKNDMKRYKKHHYSKKTRYRKKIPD